MSPLACKAILLTLLPVACTGSRASVTYRLRKLRLEGDTSGLLFKPSGQQESNSTIDPVAQLFPGEERRQSTLVCGANPQISADSERERCPDECPLHVENRFNEPVCDFYCVESSTEACVTLDPDADVPDPERGFCRSCMVQGCKECRHDGSDMCTRCRAGYRLSSDGQCHNKLFWIWYVVFGVLGFLVLLVIVWVADMACRPTVNSAALEHARRLRSRAKLRQPKFLYQDRSGDPDEANVNRQNRCLWPLKTNLCTTVVAGPSLLLSFRFQVFVIAWATILGTSWLILGLAVDTELFQMGTRRFDSPRQQCMVIQWGYETQRRLLWTKVLFCSGAYLLTFVGSLVFAVCQLRAWQRMDVQHSTHKDFTISVDGLVGFSGSERLEEELKDYFGAKTGHTIEAVSVGWAWDGDRRDLLMEIVEEDLVTLDRMRHSDSSPRTSQSSQCSEEESEEEGQSSRSNPPPVVSSYRAVLKKVEDIFLSRLMQKALTRGRSKGIPKRHKQQHWDSDERMMQHAKTAPPAVSHRMTTSGRQSPDRHARVALLRNSRSMPSPAREVSNVMETSSTDPAQEAEVDPPAEEPEDVLGVLEGLKTCGKAFVVFQKESIRDEVVRQFEREPASFRGKNLIVQAAHCEPDSVKWENLTDPELAENSRFSRLAIGLKWVLGGLVVWLCVFYAPFCWVSMAHGYHHGMEPPAHETFTFSMVVVLGNVIMYTVCSEAADRMKFTYVKDHEVAYMFFYTSACMFNVILDLVVTFFIAYSRLQGLDTRTYHGQTLDEVPTTVALSTTYGMQRELADSLMAYSFPGTFLIPFVIEPFAAIFLPYQLMVMLVRVHKQIRTATADAYLASIPFDLSRYADIHLNVTLAALILFFPGGYNLLIFFGLAISHLWIYVYDHFRVLRFSPSFDLVSMNADWWAQWMFCIPAGIILGALAFKYNQWVEHDLTKSIFGDHYGDRDKSNLGVVILCVVIFFAHVALHTVILAKVVPLFGLKVGEVDNCEEYRYCAKRLPNSWITSNPVCCLRSRYFYDHPTPITYCMRGKEHLLQRNEELGQYFEDDKTEAEDFAAVFSPSTWLTESPALSGDLGAGSRSATPTQSPIQFQPAPSGTQATPGGPTSGG